MGQSVARAFSSNYGGGGGGVCIGLAWESFPVTAMLQNALDLIVSIKRAEIISIVPFLTILLISIGSLQRGRHLCERLYGLSDSKKRLCNNRCCCLHY